MRTPGLAFVVACLVAACGGAPFTGENLLPPADDAGALMDQAAPPSEGGQEASQPALDAPALPDGLAVDAAAPDAHAPDVAQPTPETGPPPPPVDAGAPPDVTRPPPADDAGGDAAVCNLKPCMCGGAYVALCCNGPCPPGFEGLTCYCGECRFPKTYEPDAGTCQ